MKTKFLPLVLVPMLCLVAFNAGRFSMDGRMRELRQVIQRQNDAMDEAAKALRGLSEADEKLRVASAETRRLAQRLSDALRECRDARRP